VQPSLRGIDDAARVAELISGVVAGQPAAQTGRDEQADWSHGATATA
jgi:hypothetical protein